MKSYNWFSSSRACGRSSELLKILVRLLIGLLIGSLLCLRGALILAIIVWILSGTVSVLCTINRSIRSIVGNFLNKLGIIAAKIVSWSILTLIYITFFPIGRLFSRIRKIDALNLRTRNVRSYWSECDIQQRKDNNVKRMFVTERIAAKKRSLLFIGFILFLTIVSAEIILRVFGFGTPVLYNTDPIIGYYPAPRQEVIRLLGNRISINSFGMRAPEFSINKPDNTVRIFMIGDSTLYGGSYIEQDELYARLLETKFNTDYHSTEFQVLNIGVNAWGPLHKLGYVEKFGTFGSDIAVICLPIGDIFRGLTTLWELPFMNAKRPPFLAMEEVIVHLVWRYWSSLLKNPSLSSSIREEQGELEKINNGVQAYVKLAKELGERGCEVLIEILPSKTAGLSENVPKNETLQVRMLRESLEASGFKVGFPNALFNGAEKSEKIYHDSGHLDVNGHKYYAKYLYKRLKAISNTLKELESK